MKNSLLLFFLITCLISSCSLFKRKTDREQLNDLLNRNPSLAQKIETSTPPISIEQNLPITKSGVDSIKRELEALYKFADTTKILPKEITKELKHSIYIIKEKSQDVYKVRDTTILLDSGNTSINIWHDSKGTLKVKIFRKPQVIKVDCPIVVCEEKKFFEENSFPWAIIFLLLSLLFLFLLFKK